MIFRPIRGRRDDDRFVHQKMVLFAVGAVLGIAGIVREIGWLVYAAIAVLAVGVLLRFLPDRDSSGDR